MAHVQTANVQKGLFFGLFAKHAESKVEHFRRRIYRNTVHELERLSDDQLRDIGIPRDEIMRRAYHSVYHNRPYQARA
ncbi:MAG: DUF1127 domain-containing protein [Ruegeria sp.]